MFISFRESFLKTTIIIFNAQATRKCGKFQCQKWHGQPVHQIHSTEISTTLVKVYNHSATVTSTRGQHKWKWICPQTQRSEVTQVYQTYPPFLTMEGENQCLVIKISSQTSA